MPQNKSHPARVRGLKPSKTEEKEAKKKSHPARVRGLKLREITQQRKQRMSHPARVRGLKLLYSLIPCVRCSRTPHGCVD